MLVVVVTLLGVVGLSRPCMLPNRPSPALSLGEAATRAPIVVYGRVVSTHALGEPVEPVQFQVYCSYRLDDAARHPLRRTNEIRFRGDFLGNSCAFTEMREGMTYIVLLKAGDSDVDGEDSDSSALEIFKASQMTPASWEATMENLHTVADTLCTDGTAPAGTPPYEPGCVRPRASCTVPPAPTTAQPAPTDYGYDYDYFNWDMDQDEDEDDYYEYDDDDANYKDFHYKDYNENTYNEEDYDNSATDKDDEIMEEVTQNPEAAAVQGSAQNNQPTHFFPLLFFISYFLLL